MENTAGNARRCNPVKKFVKISSRDCSSDLRHGSSLHFGLLSFFLVLSAISFHFYLNTCA